MDDGERRPSIPGKHGNQRFLQDPLVKLVDATGVAPRPLEVKSLYELAEILQFAESGRNWQIVDRRIFDRLKCWFMGLPLVRQHHVAVELLHFSPDGCSVELSSLNHRGP